MPHSWEGLNRQGNKARPSHLLNWILQVGGWLSRSPQSANSFCFPKVKEACSNVKRARTSIVLKDISGIQGPERVKLRRGSGQARNKARRSAEFKCSRRPQFWLWSFTRRGGREVARIEMMKKVFHPSRCQGGTNGMKWWRGSGQARTRPGTPLNSNVIEGYPLSIKVKPRPREEEVCKPYEGSRVRVPGIWGPV